jgi:predicted dienelactone hydrolase
VLRAAVGRPRLNVRAGPPQPEASRPVGIRRVEYIDAHHSGRHLALSIFYPAAVHDRSATPFVMPFFANLHLYKDAEVAFDGMKHPLVMFSHGRGSNSLYYAWFAEVLASHGYVVAALNRYRANTYDSTTACLTTQPPQASTRCALTPTPWNGRTLG